MEQLLSATVFPPRAAVRRRSSQGRKHRCIPVVERLDRRVLMDAAAPQFVGTPTFAVEPDGTASFLVDFTDSANETHAVSVDWSDGAATPGLIDEPSAGRGTAYGQHAYTVPGSYPVTVTLTDSTGLSASTAFNAVFSPALTEAPLQEQGVVLAPPYGDSPVAGFAPEASSSAAAADSTAPRVQAVFVDSTAWASAFRSYPNTDGISANGFYVGSGAAQSVTIPWINTNQIRVQFTEPVNVVTEDLVLKGVNVGTYAFTGSVSLNAAGDTATWTLSTNIGADRLLLALKNTITDKSAELNALDGDWTDGTSAFPSGDGTTADQYANDNLFQYSFNVLPGDVTRSGTVNATDNVDTRNRQGSSTTNPGAGIAAYRVFNDVDGSAAIDGVDVTEVRNRIAVPLPGGAPMKPRLPTSAPTNFDGTIRWYGDSAIHNPLTYNTLDSMWQYSGTEHSGFLIQQSFDGVSGWTNMAPIADPNARAGKHGFIGRKYRYRIRAYSDAGVTAPAIEVIWPPFFEEDKDVKVTVQVQQASPYIKLNWPARDDVLDYVILRKRKEEATWTHIKTVEGIETSFDDAGPNGALPGVAYEYHVRRESRVGTPYGNGDSYVSAGVNVLPTVDRGTVLLLVERSLTDDPEMDLKIARLEDDLIGDGWKVQRMTDPETGNVIDAPKHIEVPRTPDQTTQYKDDLAQVKNFIVSEYNKVGANVQAVLLLGHVVIPYSGNDSYDGHEEHAGAWPADVYFGDVDGVWTDTADDTRLNTRSPGIVVRPESENLPGDGKFDQERIPTTLPGGTYDLSPVELMVGRIDMARMTMFPQSEIDLLKRYLDKNHDFRHGAISVPRRAVIDNNWSQARVNTNVFSDFASLVGPENIEDADYFPTIQDSATEGYLWAHADGPGLWYGDGPNQGLAAIGTTSNFVFGPPTKAVFHSLFGSYVGNWDIGNSFLRAPLAAEGYGLAAMWGGFPDHFTHHMALGESIGYSLRATQNNVNLVGDPPHSPIVPVSSLYGDSQHMGRIHISLMGDPTLRLHPVSPVTALTKTADGSGVRLNWTAPSDPGVFSYYVFVRSAAGEPFVLRDDTPMEATTYLHSGGSTSSTYMVRAVKLEDDTNGGTYYNLSQGVYSS